MSNNSDTQAKSADLEHSPHEAPAYMGAPATRTYTPGGHVANEDLIVAASSHRKYGNPVPSGLMAFGSTLLLHSLYMLHVADIELANGVLTLAIVFGGLSQYLSGLWSYASGNTFGGTFMVAYACYWWGQSIIAIPFFGMVGTYDGQPGIYSATGMAASEAANAVGLFYWVWFGITACFLFSSFRSSGALVLFLFLLTLTFAMLGAHQYTGSAGFERAAGGLGVAASMVAYYVSAASFWTRNTSYFFLPVLRLSPKKTN